MHEQAANSLVLSHKLFLNVSDDTVGRAYSADWFVQLVNNNNTEHIIITLVTMSNLSKDKLKL